MMKTIMQQLGICGVSLVFCLLAACQSEDALQQASDEGYLRIELQNVVSTTEVGTKAVSENYDPKRFQITITNAKGVAVKTLENIAVSASIMLETIALPVGDYTITASSAGFDGSESGFDIPYYSGSATAKVAKNTSTPVTVKCTLANVKVTVNFDASMNQFQSATATISSGLSGVASREFEMGKINKSAYFPVGSLTLTLAVLTDNNKLHTQNYAIKPTNRDVQARDHFIINFKVPTYGSMDGITITADDETKNYTINFPVYRYPRTTLRVEAANAWSNFAYVQGTAVSANNTPFEAAQMKFRYKQKTAPTWNEVSATETGTTDGTYSYKATLSNLSPNTEYEYQLAYNNAEYTSDAVSFTTETQLKGGSAFNWSFDDWYKNGKHYYAAISENARIWDSGNEGANTLGEVNPTRPEETDIVKGEAAARLGSTTAAGQFAAGSLFTGDFGSASLSPLGAKLDFGRPFTERPSQLTGYYKYNPGTIDKIKTDKVSAVAKGDLDICSIYIALLDWTKPFAVSTGDNVFFNPETTPGVIAYGELSADECSPKSMSNYKQFTINLKYRDLTKKPTYILVVCSSSKYGDYFTGSTSSVLLLDEFDLIYGEPTIDTEYITTK